MPTVRTQNEDVQYKDVFSPLPLSSTSPHHSCDLNSISSLVYSLPHLLLLHMNRSKNKYMHIDVYLEIKIFSYLVAGVY